MKTFLVEEIKGGHATTIGFIARESLIKVLADMEITAQPKFGPRGEAIIDGGGRNRGHCFVFREVREILSPQQLPSALYPEQRLKLAS